MNKFKSGDVVYALIDFGDITERGCSYTVESYDPVDGSMKLLQVNDTWPSAWFETAEEWASNQKKASIEHELELTKIQVQMLQDTIKKLNVKLGFARDVLLNHSGYSLDAIKVLERD